MMAGGGGRARWRKLLECSTEEQARSRLAWSRLSGGRGSKEMMAKVKREPPALPGLACLEEEGPRR